MSQQWAVQLRKTVDNASSNDGIKVHHRYNSQLLRIKWKTVVVLSVDTQTLWEAHACSILGAHSAYLLFLLHLEAWEWSYHYILHTAQPWTLASFPGHLERSNHPHPHIRFILSLPTLFTLAIGSLIKFTPPSNNVSCISELVQNCSSVTSGYDNRHKQIHLMAWEWNYVSRLLSNYVNTHWKLKTATCDFTLADIPPPKVVHSMIKTHSHLE